MEIGEEFISLIQPYTKSSPQRIRGMAKAVMYVDRFGVPGDIVECGVWRGGNIILSRKLSPDRTCWLYDTYRGMTKPCEWDTTRSGHPASISYEKKQVRGAGWAACSLEDVQINLIETDTYHDDKLKFIVGDVIETLQRPENIPDQIAVLRLDTDWYQSTKVELQKLWPRLSPNGVLIIDDYGHWLGARKATDEYFANEAGVAFEGVEIDYTAVMMVKPCL